MFWKNGFQCDDTTESVEACSRRGWEKVELGFNHGYIEQVLSRRGEWYM